MDEKFFVIFVNNFNEWVIENGCIGECVVDGG